ncbi:chaperonin 10-like protein [Lipomyces starkeyi]
MPPIQNLAAWLPGVGKELQVAPASTPYPGENELLIETKAVAVQPAEYKIQEGILPFELTYPTIIGLSFAGIVVKVGAGVTRFKEGDRIVTNSAGTIRNDARFGAYQRYALTSQELTAKIGDVPFENASAISSFYAAVSALILHLHLDRPSSNRKPSNKAKKVLIWGASSSLGAFAVQLASNAGYTVVGVASAHNAQLVEWLGAAHFIDRKSPSVVQDLTSLGPFEAVLAAADSASDQVTIGQVLAAHGGGSFLSTMGVRKGVQLPPGVTGHFAQYLDDYLKPENREFSRWVWWNLIEEGLIDGKIKLLPVDILGGLSTVQEAWNLEKNGQVSGRRLIIRPDID